MRGKALLSLYFITKQDPSSFLSFCQSKVLPILERIARDKESYVRQCMKIAMHSILELVPSITSKITSEINKIVERGKPTNSSVKTLSVSITLYM
jgi:serine/threonine-protein kinase ULK4